MRGTLTARAGAIAIGLVVLFGARPAAAIDIELPGERKLEIHGFYETRLLFVGADLPANDVTFSSFRHVVSLDLEVEVFPDGWGPFDFMFVFTRLAVSYECIYERACGLFKGADSFGSRPRRQAGSLVEAKNSSPYTAGLIRQRIRPGSFVDPREELTPRRRYRDCINPPGVFQNPFPLAGFCNFNNRSVLDGPLDTFAGAVVRTRSGHFNIQGRLNLLLAARGQIGDERFGELLGLLQAEKLVDFTDETQRRNLLRRAFELETAGDSAGAAAFRADAAAIRAGTFDEAIPALIGTRPDVNRFEAIANATFPEILTAKWGAGQNGSQITSFLASIETPIRPDGYFRGGVSLDFIGEVDEGLAEDALNRDLTTVPAGLSTRFTTLGALDNAVFPFFTGPDGIRNTKDDLPFFEGNSNLVDEEAKIFGVEMAAPVAGGTFFGGTVFARTFQVTVENATDPGTTRIVELYGEFSETRQRQFGCLRALGGTLDPATGECTVDGVVQDDTRVQNLGCAELRSRGETIVGINADNKCVQINAFSNNRAEFELLTLYGRREFRPSTAASEPIDATDFKVAAVQSGLGLGGALLTAPARPRAKGNGLFFQTPGMTRILRSKHNLVSNLDVDFTEDELRWDHGAAQDEHEFKEGYVELEMFDSQLFMRIGKLITVWGKTELFRNQDRLNPVDIGNGLFQPLEEARIGQWGTQIIINPEAWMRVGPFEDLRVEIVGLFDDFEPTDLGKCGEGSGIELVCGKSFGAIAHGLVGIGLVGEIRPDDDYDGLQRMDFGMRVEGRLDRFTFSISDFWGWDDGFYLDVVNQYGREVDLVSGAPSNKRNGKCRVRTSDGKNIGPNGVRDTLEDASGNVIINPITGNPQFEGDDNVASSGAGCLLFTGDENDAGESILRTPEQVAINHTVNQTLFHTICTLTFDADTGFCAFDQLNNPTFFPLIAQVLGAKPGIAVAAVPGLETIRRSTSPFQSNLDPVQVDTVFTAPGSGFGNALNDIPTILTDEQEALLGCGPQYLAPCSEVQLLEFIEDGGIANSIGRDASTLLGGLDFMNADASVLTGDWSTLKGLSPGAMVGTRLNNGERLVFLPGISSAGLKPGDFIQMSDKERAAFAGATLMTGAACEGADEDEECWVPSSVAKTDATIEPMPWTVNRELRKKFGAVVYNVANRLQTDVRCDPDSEHFNAAECDDLTAANGGTAPVNDPFDPANPANEFNRLEDDPTTVYGEFCSDALGNNTPFKGGCTPLEIVSSNLERFLMANELIGFDDTHDPPESLTELINWGRDNFAIAGFGDPISGSDGIFAYTDFVFNDEEMDTIIVEREAGSAFLVTPRALLPGETRFNTAELASFLDTYDPTTCVTGTCFLQIGVSGANRELISPMPIAIPAEVVGGVNPAGQPLPAGSTIINLLSFDSSPTRRDRFKLGELLAGRATEVLIDGVATTVRLLQAEIDSLTPRVRGDSDIDFNEDGTSDLDQDNDGVYDGIDDFTPGPITDDNILCGSGIPGDTLQEAIQYESYRRDEAPGSAKFAASFPDGLPPRSPVFCRGVSGVLGATGQTLPVIQAGGDGNYGRRDFLWHGGQQVALRYQKRNVFGFGLDFAEDVTKTSWGIEFSWTANKLFSNNRERSGLSESDELVLSVSVDRPTFFNFLNPNRSFFVNFQFFIRYLPQFDGNTRDRDGNFGAAAGPIDANVVLTFFTGYFQDRLNPRLSFLWVPTMNQYALISGLGYRWNESFSTSLGFTHFFGKLTEGSSARFPISLLTSPESRRAVVNRGVTAVINRDQLTGRIRYSF